MTKRAAMGIAIALMLGACAKNNSNQQAQPQQPAAETAAEAQEDQQSEIADCSATFVRDYFRVFEVNSDFLNNRVYGNFSAMEDRINRVALKNACETFNKNPVVETCRAQGQDATWHLSSADLAQICDSNRK